MSLRFPSRTADGSTGLVVGCGQQQARKSQTFILYLLPMVTISCKTDQGTRLFKIIDGRRVWLEQPPLEWFYHQHQNYKLQP